VSDTTLLATTITIMSDSKELSVLRAASQRLFDSDDDGTIIKFCHRAADVSAFEDALQQCSTEHFRTEAAAMTPSAAAQQGILQETMKRLLWWLLTNALTRNERANMLHHLSWSVDGYSMVARIAQSILSSWCIGKKWIDDIDHNGYTVFMHAASNGHTCVVELLLADPRVDRASIDLVNQHGRTALMYAAFNGHASVIELLLADPCVDKAFIDHSDEDGKTALMLAATDGRTSVIELLLADPRVDKASIDHANSHGETALMHAVEQGHTSMVELLLADPRVDKASIDHVNATGMTALSHASSNGRTSVVQLLLADPRVDKASIDHTDVYGDSVLWCAAVRGHFPVAKLLMSDSRTSWDSIVDLAHHGRVMKHDDIRPLVIAELTHRQMRVIYPSTNRQQWPVPAQSDAETGDAESSGPAADDDGREDGIAESEPVSECALITSFFKSDLFDVNVLRIIREYATYTCSATETYTDSDSD
jgi:ankyrin repeat protein